jgi:hypothetical protein
MYKLIWEPMKYVKLQKNPLDDACTSSLVVVVVITVGGGGA